MGRIFFFYSLICFVLLSKSFSSSFLVHHPCSTSEALALLQFKQPFEIYNESSWLCYRFQTSFPKTISWNESTDCCTWEGVTCDMLTGHVIGLDLSCSKLNGTIHQNSSLFQLHHLQTLNLAFNFFNWSVIPSDIGRLTDLRQPNLSDSSFSGKIPTEISYPSNLVSLDLSFSWCELDQKTFETLLQNLTNLEVVSVSSVNISSPIPMNMSSSLRYVDLEATNLLCVLTESFFLLPKLERLKLGNNDLRGVLPKIKPSNTLLELDIANTGVYGRLPDSIGTFNSLNYLNLERCNFSGSIPDSLGNLTQIRELNFGENHFTGHIPSTISKLMQLTSLDLSSNSLSGDIPNVFSNFQKLVKLDLSENIFTGPFPSSILSLGSLQSLELSSNSLSGPLPSNASMLLKLAYMDLSHNSLNGTIPSWVFNIPSYHHLKLDHNRFSRLDVADKLKTNPAVKVLDLSHNQLSVPVLRSLENLVNLFKLDLSSNNITDNVGIEIFMTMQRLDYLDVSYNPLSWKSSKIAFPSLRVLLLSSCELEDFPYLLRNLKKLQILDLSNNKIHGPIPNWFSRMRWDSLQYLNVSLNSLTGHLEQLHQYNLRILDFKFNFLQGPIPSSICNMSSLEFLDLSRNNFSESIPNCFGSMAELLVLDLRKKISVGVFHRCVLGALH